MLIFRELTLKPSNSLKELLKTLTPQNVSPKRYVKCQAPQYELIEILYCEAVGLEQGEIEIDGEEENLEEIDVNNDEDDDVVKDDFSNLIEKVVLEVKKNHLLLTLPSRNPGIKALHFLK